MVELVKMQWIITPVAAPQNSLVTDVEQTFTLAMEKSVETMEPFRLKPIHYTVPVQMVLLETDVKILMNVSIILVKMVGPAKMESTLIPVIVQMGSQERHVKPTLMTVMESAVRTMGPVWMQSTLSHVTV